MAVLTGTPPALTSESPGSVILWARQLHAWLAGQVLADDVVIPDGTDGQVVGYDENGDLIAMDLPAAADAAWTRYHLTYADFADAEIHTEVVLRNQSASEHLIITAWFLKHSVAFSGGGIGAVTILAGDSTDSDSITSATGLGAESAPSASNYLVNGATTPALPFIIPPGESLVLDLYVDSPNTCDELTAGEVDFWVQQQVLSPG